MPAVQKKLKEILGRTAHIALATSSENNANVRLMTIGYDESKGVICFPTARRALKVAELDHNSSVAFTTIADLQNGIVRVKNATVNRSELCVDEFRDGIARNDPAFAKRLQKDVFAVYEMRFKKAYVTVFGEAKPQQEVEVDL